ncbi:MAG: putative baseplate assembly protein, partial [Anaerolineae bacterium]|nr:putative baseplate assembly protein [Anaerolineae bacterium]
MPFIPPALDDRSYQDLVDELIARIPAHTPDWTNPRDGDPGRTLIELFAWLADTLLYRANLIPERQRLAFLRLLGIPLRPAIPARGVVSVQYDSDTTTSATSIRPLATLTKPVHFETLQELTVLPITAEVYYKRGLTDDEEQDLREVITGLRSIYGLSQARPYVTATAFPGGAMEPNGFEIVSQTVDRSLWLALLAPKKELVGAVKEALGANPTGGQQLLNIGIVPTIRLPDSFEDIGKRGGIAHTWEITGVDTLGRPDYFTLDVIEDNTDKLTKRGVIRLALPAAEFIAAPSNDVRRNFQAGVGDQPPRLDAADKADRLVAWVRLRPTRVRPNEQVPSLSLSWIGINAVEIDQRQTISGRVVGQSDGASGQVMSLRAGSVDPNSLEIEVEEVNQGYVKWQAVPDLALAGRDDAVFRLDPEAVTITFGDGLRGRVPVTGARVRVAFMRAGGGIEGNLPPGSLTEITAQATLPNVAVPKLKVQQMAPTDGGEMAETIAQAELRIPAIFRHRDRAITVEDYRQLAADTPGVRLGRVEVLPKFRPQQRRPNVPGVVSVMVLPY